MRNRHRADSRPAVDDELAFHIEQRVRDYMARGMDEDTARRAVRERMGDLERVRVQCAALEGAAVRSTRRRNMLDDLRQDVSFGLRGAARAPLFTAVAVITLMLGIGANAAVFSVVKSVLLDALPYERADRLVRVYTRSDGTDERMPLSAGVVADIGARMRSFQHAAAFLPAPFEVIHRPEGAPRVLDGAWVEPGFLETLGVQPELGRTFRPDDGPFVVLLSHETWQRDFGGDSAVIGTTTFIDADARTIAGVLPRGFVGPMGPADLWFRLNLEASLSDADAARRRQPFGLVARLQPTASVETARAELATLARDLAREHPDTDAGRTLLALPLRTTLVGDTRAPLLALMGSAVLVLLITCANLSGALLTRALERRREFAVRTALGARRGRLARQLLTESTLIALAGAAAGLLLATAGLTALRSLALPALPAYADLSLDGGTLGVIILVALVAGSVLGVAPALAAGREGVQATLREAARGSSEGAGTRRVRGVLVAGQLALCLSLLVGAGLLGRSLIGMTAAPLGYDPHGVLTFSVKGPVPARDSERRQFFERLEERIGALPGVRAVANTDVLPQPALPLAPFEVRGRPTAEEELVALATVSDDYFETMGIRVLRGRPFDARDGMDAPPVVAVSEAFARRHWPSGDALGARLRMDRSPDAPWAEVVAIVGDVRADPALAGPSPIVYGPAHQSPLRGSRTYIVRAEGEPRALSEPIRRALADLDASVPMDRVATLADLLGANLGRRRLPALLMGAFALLALLLAAVGVYALFAGLAGARRQEFGIRMALGSTPSAIAKLVVRQGAGWMLAGLAGGAAGAVVIAHALRGLLFGISPLDPAALALAVAALIIAAALALLVPVLRAARTDPGTALH